MNKITRLLALLLLVVMTFSMVSCDKIPFLGEIFGDNQTDTPDGEQDDTNTPPADDGQVVATIAELTELFDANKSFYVVATVKEITDASKGAMVITDETGEITVGEIAGWAGLEARPNEYDEIVLVCELAKSKGKVYVKSASLEKFVPGEAPINTITIAEAIEICAANTNETERLYYIRATVTRVSNPTYGEMYIADETGELLVYNTKNADGTVGYADMDERPVKGDEVLLFCTLNNHNGTNQVKSAWIIEFTHTEVELDLTKYTEATLAEARAAEADALLKVKGVVAQITYSNGMKPQGVVLVDGTSSIYAYDPDLAGQVKVGNTVEIAGTKTYYVLSTEQSNADKFGYKGACQLDSVTVLSVDKNVVDFDKTWITETTVKEIMDTPVTENITNLIYKVNALVVKAPGNGFVNYYIDDIDGETGSYVYTQCNGSDFGWLDEFDGKICTVYLVAQNAKASSSGCVWRFLPIAVIDEGYTFNTDNAGEYAVKYVGLGQFLSFYTGDPAIKLETTVSSELLGFEGATLSYSSSNEAVVYFTSQDGVVTFHGGEAGTATVTVTGSYNGKEYSETVEIEIKEAAEFETISITDAVAKEIGEEVVIRGIVGPSLINQAGFYLFDESGMVAVRVSDASVFDTIAIGNEVVVKGIRDMWHKEGSSIGQIVVSNATIEVNYYGEHDYHTIDLITDKDVKYIYDLDENDMSETTNLYLITATIKVVDGGYSSNIYLSDGTTDLRLYCSSSSQYSWLKAYAGQTLLVEVAPCNWNSKNYYTGCALAVYLEDGTVVLNNYNFK